MSVASRPCTHRHGNRNRHLPRSCHERCRCTPCRTASNRYQRTRRQHIKAGNPLTVPVGPIRELLAQWRTQGYGPVAVAAAAGIARSHIQGIAAGKFTRIHQVTADAITNAKPAAPTRVNAIGTRRRLQALAAVGFPMHVIAAATGLNADHLEALAYRTRHKFVTGALATAVARAYDDLCTDDGTLPRSEWVRVHARKLGCQGPEAWTDDTIDAPKVSREKPPAVTDAELDVLRSYHREYERLRANQMHISAHLREQDAQYRAEMRRRRREQKHTRNQLAGAA